MKKQYFLCCIHVENGRGKHDDYDAVIQKSKSRATSTFRFLFHLNCRNLIAVFTPEVELFTD